MEYKLKHNTSSNTFTATFTKGDVTQTNGTTVEIELTQETETHRIKQQIMALVKIEQNADKSNLLKCIYDRDEIVESISNNIHLWFELKKPKAEILKDFDKMRVLNDKEVNHQIQTEEDLIEKSLAPELKDKLEEARNQFVEASNRIERTTSTSLLNIKQTLIKNLNNISSSCCEMQG